MESLLKKVAYPDLQIKKKSNVDVFHVNFEKVFFGTGFNDCFLKDIQ